MKKNELAVHERRQHPRIEVLNPAGIYLPDRHEPMVCLVLDWSPGGARLHPDDIDQCRDFFTLVTQDGSETACQVVWRRDEELGVKFLKRNGPEN